ncbi:PatB family C-S lyase [Lacrimispora sp. NSJ-141]|uniref:cysteine-S-conjugate beta-lyase n=1 Tax=Lientehia hominis TaxID=2897778 RepID=A0AAP2W9V7_9FIRM|nr:PatB family C-S lyase [Lientehia hominis]MCD2492357.1 PatB family C-S lyase [Lientehia hominis]
MIYDFDTPVNRRNTNSLEWDVSESELPMRGDDMGFETAPEIRTAITAHAAQGVFGYNTIPDTWARSYVDWWANRHNYSMEKDWLVFCTGVMPAISSMVRKLTTPAEKILVQTPACSSFFDTIVNNGRQVLQNPLKYDENGYSVDFVDLEQKLADPQTTLMILCNPHDPAGRVWDRDTLLRIGRLCMRHHVTVISDEIFCDLISPGKQYIPFVSVSEECRENSVTCITPTKTFNLAGLQTAALAVPNDALRYKVWRALNTDEAAEPNSFAVTAAVAAFTKGAAWLDELRVYLHENKSLAEEYVKNEIADIRIVPSEIVHLLWLDCTKIIGFIPEAAGFIRERTGLYLSAGGQFGAGGEHFLWMNAACPRAVLMDGLTRLKEGIAAYEEYMINLC